MADGVLIRVRGQVQGVGFRPFIWALCSQMGLRGDVLNDPEGVVIRAAGSGLAALPDRIRAEAPPLARVDAVEMSALEFDPPEGFAIAASEGSGNRTAITPDAATCPDCLAELRNPSDRRFGYPFANCTNCGPRFSIVEGMPYDRAQTTMAGFALCAACQAEYDNPADRRFHAQPVACAICGPRLWLEVDAAVLDDPISRAAEMLRDGKSLAIKGLGGFHLACDAGHAEAVARLRARKRRPTKPFALMGTLEMIRAHGPVSAAAEARLVDPAAPIVLMEATRIPDGIAPGQTTLGWMLPATPLHHLLLDAVGRPLVMTSGNLSGSPQVIGNDEARQDLAEFVDGFLMHDRPIARRLDDSVERADPPMILRRARGRVPGTLPLPLGFEGASAITAYGGQMKGALCLLEDGQALLGHHLGDLDNALSYDAFLQADRDYAEIFDHQPVRVACDLHPDFAATKHAMSLGVPVTQVQHHHAHLASCMAENGWPLEGGKVAGIVLDGLGLGPDGTVWGGELLLGDYIRVERRAWLAPASLPGGDLAQREPWRNLLARLDNGPIAQNVLGRLLADKPVEMLRQAISRGINAPLSSSAGRLFDAVAALVFQDVSVQSFEGEFAMRLEAAAARADRAEPLSPPRCDGMIETSEMMHHMASLVVSGATPQRMALGFHQWLVQAFAAPARALIEAGEAQAIALSGGCFQNAVLHRLIVEALSGLPVLTHQITPANDGGLALGQAVVAAAQGLEAE